MSQGGRVAIVGSIDVDHVVTGGEPPAAGQTVTGGSFALHPGGKGANQAVAAARWGAIVRFLGAVGDDSDGRAALKALRVEGANVDAVATADATTRRHYRLLESALARMEADDAAALAAR